MKKATIFLLLFSQILISQEWEDIEQPYSMNITDFEILNDGIGILTTGSLEELVQPSGIFRTTDFGESWVSQPYFLQSYFETFAIEEYNNNLYLSTSSNGIFISREKGIDFYTRIWQFDGNFRAFDEIYKFGNELFIIDNFYITKNLNQTDTLFSADLIASYPEISFENNVEALYKKEDVLFAVTTNTGVIKSSDDGKSWIKASGGILDSNITQISGNNGDLFVSVTDEGLYKSSDGGENWSLVEGTDDFFTNGSECRKIFPKGDSLYLAMWDGIYLSEDSNLDFTNILEDFSSGISALNFFDEKLYYAPDFGNLHIIENGMDTEIPISRAKQEITTIDGDNFTIFYGNTLGMIVKYSRITNETEILKEYNVYSENPRITELLYENNVLVAADESGRLFYSLDAGANIEEFQAEGVISDLSFEGNNLFAIIDSVVYSGSFADENFSKVDEVLDSYKALDIVAQNNTLYIATLENGILEYDMVAREISNLDDLQNKQIEIIEENGNNELVYLEKTSFIITDVGRYINGNYEYFTMPSNMPKTRITTINANGDNIICGLEATIGGHIFSTDGGDNFTLDFIDGNPQGGLRATSSLVTNNHFYLAWTGSLKKIMSKKIIVNSLNESLETQAEIRLENDKLIIDNVEIKGNYQINLFDINGKEISSESIFLNVGKNQLNINIPMGLTFVDIVDLNNSNRRYTGKLIR